LLMRRLREFVGRASGCGPGRGQSPWKLRRHPWRNPWPSKKPSGSRLPRMRPQQHQPTSLSISRLARTKKPSCVFQERFFDPILLRSMRTRVRRSGGSGDSFRKGKLSGGRHLKEASLQNLDGDARRGEPFALLEDVGPARPSPRAQLGGGGAHAALRLAVTGRAQSSHDLVTAEGKNFCDIKRPSFSVGA
jgi:hypothetical protein